MIKVDGHSHTQYCPHGTVDDVELLIQEAIRQGFTRYSITEHAPLPKGFADLAAGPDYPIDTAGMAWSDWEHYLKTMHALKKKYSSDIAIQVGIELDYLPELLDDTRDFLAMYGSQLDDGLLSVHFLPGLDGLRAVDWSAQDFAQGLIAYYGDFQAVTDAYLAQVMASVQADLGPYKPKRIAHVSLNRKFVQSQYMQGDTAITMAQLAYYQQIFGVMEAKGYSLDFNMAGLFKADCQAPYPPLALAQLAHQSGLTLVYGSDSHDLADLGRGYDTYQKLMSQILKSN